MDEDDAYVPEYDDGSPADVPFRRPSPYRRVLATSLVLAALAAAAEYGYRMFDQNTSPEVRPRGIALPGIAVSGSSIDFSVASPDPFHAFHISVSCDNGTDADADAARIGLFGTLSAREETGARRQWSAPIQLIASEDRIVSRPSVEDALLTKSQDGLVGLGVRHRIDYVLDPDPLSPGELESMRSLSHPAGTRLAFHLELERPLPRNSRIYLSYARAPRLLHQALLRPPAASAIRPDGR